MITLPRAIATLAAAATLALAACSDNSTGGSASRADVDPYLGDIVMGDASAPVEIIEYASLSCPHCRDFWKQDFPRLKTNYIDTGRVRYVLKDFPTPPVELAVAATAIARCAGEDGYYEVVDDVFTQYHDIMEAMRTSSGALPLLIEIGGRAGLSTDEVRACINHDGVQSYINEMTQEGVAKGVSATPTIFVNGEVVSPHDYASLSAAIDAILDPNAAAAPTPGEDSE